MFSSPILVAALAAASLAQAASAAAVQCKLVQFPVSVTATNADFGDDFSPDNATSIDQFVTKALTSGRVGVAGQAAVSASFSISAQYCAPVGARYLRSIQVLAHGNTCDRTIWDALGQPSLQAAGYSYQRFFASQGYATLALDLPGHGGSTRSDPNKILQMSIEAAVINAISSSLRSSKNPLGLAFQNIIFTGHSYGSITGVAAARLTPKFADAMVLTGWSANVPLPSPLLQLQMQPAALVSQRFKGYPLGYITASNRTGYGNVFYGGSFDPTIPAISFDHQDIMTCGEGGSLGDGLQPATSYKGKVLAITGDKDVLYCNSQNGACASQLASSKVMLPNAIEFQTYVVPNTGHDLMLHASHAQTFGQIQKFLKKILID